MKTQKKTKNVGFTLHRIPQTKQAVISRIEQMEKIFKNHPDEELILRSADVMGLLGIKYETLYNLRKDGIIPFFTDDDDLVFYKFRDVYFAVWKNKIKTKGFDRWQALDNLNLMSYKYINLYPRDFEYLSIERTCKKSMSMSRKKTFVFNLEWCEILEGYEEKVQLEVYDAVFKYVETGIVPKELKPLARMAFTFIKREIDYNEEKYNKTIESRRSAGRKGAERRWSMPEVASESSEVSKVNASKGVSSVGSKQSKGGAKNSENKEV